MTFNILYNNAPTKNLISNINSFNDLDPSDNSSFIWNDYDDHAVSTRRTDIHEMFNILGIDYNWSNQEEDSLAFVNIGSVPHLSERFKNIVKYASETFSKPIIYTSQEPWQLKVVEEYLNKYDNIIMMDNSVPVNGKQYLPRYKPFPFMICRMLSIPTNIMMVYPDLSYNRISQKFNCLLWNWRIEKHVCLTYLKKKQLDKNNIITYKVNNPNFIAQNNVNKRLNDFFDGWNENNEKQKQEIKEFSLELLTTLDDINLENDISIKPNHPTIDSSFRALPRYVYEETGFSLVCESFCGSSWDYDTNQELYYKDSQAFITEKTLFPLMNGHPWLTFGEHDFYKAMESFGFYSHDELFDLSFDSNPNSLDRIDAITDIVKNIDLNKIKNVLTNRDSETHKKIRHNKYQMFNTNSFLWKKLRLQFTKYMDEILEL